MTRHIVVTLHGMAKRSVVVPSFRYDFVESYFQISSHVGIGILVQSQACRRMLDEYIHHTDVNGREFLLMRFGKVRREKETETETETESDSFRHVSLVIVRSIDLS